MAVVRLEIKTRQPLADGRKFDHVGCYEQLDGTAHFAVDPAHRLNCAVTDIDLAERGRDGLVHFTADVRILAPADQARGNHGLLFDVPNRGNRLALATFNGGPRRVESAAIEMHFSDGSRPGQALIDTVNTLAPARVDWENVALVKFVQ